MSNEEILAQARIFRRAYDAETFSHDAAYFGPHQEAWERGIALAKREKAIRAVLPQ